MLFDAKDCCVCMYQRGGELTYDVGVPISVLYAHRCAHIVEWRENAGKKR